MAKKQCRFRFYGNLNDFLAVDERERWIAYPLDGTVAVKHPIEALGVPHPEVETIVVDELTVGFDHRLCPGQAVHVYPSDHISVTPEPVRLRPPLERPPTFVLDTHLGKLAAYLRMLGFDAVYRNDFDDAELADTAAEEHRVLLTRDRGLLKRKIITYGYCVRQSIPRRQLVNVIRRYDLGGEARPWSRCIRCNGPLQPVSKADIWHLLEPKTRCYYDDFQQCTSCGQVYWRGSHHRRMRRFLDGVLSEAQSPAGTGRNMRNAADHSSAP